MRVISTLAVAGILSVAATPALAANFIEGSVGTNANASFPPRPRAATSSIAGS